jgi:spore maturation protein CgeB
MVLDYTRTIILSFPVAFKLNAFLKARQLKYRQDKLNQKYNSRIRNHGFQYSREISIDAFHERISFQKYKKKRFGDLGIFWVGANRDQDESGFLQALRRCGEVYEFKNAHDGYGLWYSDSLGKVRVFDKEIVKLNDRCLLKQVSSLLNENKIDILIGQMWANYVSVECLQSIQKLGVPVINISMDDRLPDNWMLKNGVRLGSVGLAGGVDIVLTTSSECCAWYGLEGASSIFWPLASDPSIFRAKKNAIRDIDVLFIGNKYGIRAKIINELKDLGVNVTCYGNGWKNGPSTAEESTELYKSSKIILGIGTIGHCEDLFTMKLRDFDAPMSGALYITHRTQDLTNLYIESEEIECYSSPKEASQKILFYLNNPLERNRVGLKGQNKALARYTWDKRLTETFIELGLMNHE